MSTDINNKEALIRAKEILNDFMKDFDMKRLISAFYAKCFGAGLFGRFKEDQVLQFNFNVGKYHYYMERSPIGYISPEELKQQILTKSAILKNLQKQKAMAQGKTPSPAKLREMAKKGLLD